MDTYLGNDAKLYLEDLIGDYQDKINELEEENKDIRQDSYDEDDLDDAVNASVHSEINDLKKTLKQKVVEINEYIENIGHNTYYIH